MSTSPILRCRKEKLKKGKEKLGGGQNRTESYEMSLSSPSRFMVPIDTFFTSRSGAVVRPISECVAEIMCTSSSSSLSSSFSLGDSDISSGDKMFRTGDIVVPVLKWLEDVEVDVVHADIEGVETEDEAYERFDSG